MAASGVAENFLNKALPLHSSEKYRFRTSPASFLGAYVKNKLRQKVPQKVTIGANKSNRKLINR
jgi:cytochrome c